MPTERRRVAIDTDEAFALITSVGRLPEWNRAITRVIAVPRSLDALAAVARHQQAPERQDMMP